MEPLPFSTRCSTSTSESQHMAPSHSKVLTIESARAFLIDQCFTPWPRATASDSPGLIGVELELYPVVTEDGEIRPLSDLSGLFNACKRMPHSAPIEHTDLIAHKIFYSNLDSIQFEPGGQIELITGPVNSLPELFSRLSALRKLVEEAGSSLNVSFGQYAMQPWFEPRQIQLKIQNDRYQNMIDYFDSISEYGRRMMLESCSLQINLDLGYSPEQVVQRIILANLLAPVSTALFANSRTYSGIPTQYNSYRYHVWQNLDDRRTGISYANGFDSRTSLSDIVQSYLHMALKAPVIESPGIHTHGRIITFEEWMQKGIDDLYPDTEALKKHLTYLFPDVRIRRFIELRSIDVPPEGWEFVPISFYCGLLYYDEALSEALYILMKEKGQLHDFVQESVYGLRSDRLFEVCKSTYQVALDGYHRLPDQFKLQVVPEKSLELYFEEFVLRRKTFADLPNN